MKKIKKGGGSSGTIYALGFIGAVIYFVQTSQSFGGVVYGFIKAIFWPGFLVYKAFESLGL